MQQIEERRMVQGSAQAVAELVRPLWEMGMTVTGKIRWYTQMVPGGEAGAEIVVMQAQERELLAAVHQIGRILGQLEHIGNGKGPVL